MNQFSHFGSIQQTFSMVFTQMVWHRELKVNSFNMRHDIRENRFGCFVHVQMVCVTFVHISFQNIYYIFITKNNMENTHIQTLKISKKTTSTFFSFSSLSNNEEHFFWCISWWYEFGSMYSIQSSVFDDFVKNSFSNAIIQGQTPLPKHNSQMIATSY